MTKLMRREHRKPLSKLLRQASPVLIDYYALRSRSAATSRSRGSKTDVLSDLPAAELPCPNRRDAGGIDHVIKHVVLVEGLPKER
jgi:hypothetical protein